MSEKTILRLKTDGVSDYKIARKLRMEMPNVTRSRKNTLKKINLANFWFFLVVRSYGYAHTVILKAIHNETPRCLRMRKAVKVAWVCLLIFIGTLSFTLVFASVLAPGSESSGIPDPHANDSVLPKVEGVTKNDGFYNISLAFINVTYAENLENILINPNNSKAPIGLVAYMNGTALDESAPIACKLEGGDSMQINITLPISEFASGETVNLCVMGEGFGCGLPIVLP